MAFRYRYSKKVKKRSRRGRRKTTHTKHSVRSSGLLGKVAKIAMLMNVEKKRFCLTPIAVSQGDITTFGPAISMYAGGTVSTFSQAPVPVGQIYAADGLSTQCVGGWVAWDATPIPEEGPGYNQRDGSSLKCVSFYQKFQFWQQKATNAPSRLKLYTLLIKGAVLPSATELQSFVNNIFLTSSFPVGVGIDSGAGIVDYNSTFDPDYRATFSILNTKYIKLRSDNLADQTQITEATLGKKWQHHVRFNGDQNYPTSGQIIQILFCDQGNANVNNAFDGEGTATLPGVNTDGEIAASSGVWFNFNLTHYYVDN